VRPSKRAKKSNSGLHADWAQRIQVEAPHEEDFDELGLGDVQPSMQPSCDDDLIVEKAHVRSHSPSSGKSFSSLSRPQSLPDSDDDSEGGLADDSEERLGMERKHLSGKALHPEVLKSRYSRSMSTAVCLQVGLVTETNDLAPVSRSCARWTPSLASSPQLLFPILSNHLRALKWRKCGSKRVTSDSLTSHLTSRPALSMNSRPAFSNFLG
jgi:hypothetical protein